MQPGRTLAIVLALAALTEPLTAQHARVTWSRTVNAPAMYSAAATSGGTAFGYEAVGGVAGSLVGFGIGYVLVNDDCETDDIVCEIRSAGIAIAIATGGAAAGTVIVGRAFDTEPSVIGAVIGAVVGAVAGVGATHLVTEDIDVIRSRTGAIITYSVAQGIVTALGSRIARRLSNR